MSNANKALKGSFLLVLTKLSEKSLGIVSTLVLARLLVPDDFGLVAIANLIIGLVSIMADTGSGLYLIQKEEVDDDDINTSWTINLILQTMLFVFLVLITPFASEYYQDDLFGGHGVTSFCHLCTTGGRFRRGCVERHSIVRARRLCGGALAGRFRPWTGRESIRRRQNSSSNWQKWRDSCLPTKQNCWQFFNPGGRQRSGCGRADVGRT